MKSTADVIQEWLTDLGNYINYDLENEDKKLSNDYTLISRLEEEITKLKNI